MQTVTTELGFNSIAWSRDTLRAIREYSTSNQLRIWTTSKTYETQQLQTVLKWLRWTTYNQISLAELLLELVQFLIDAHGGGKKPAPGTLTSCHN